MEKKDIGAGFSLSGKEKMMKKKIGTKSSCRCLLWFVASAIFVFFFLTYIFSFPKRLQLTCDKGPQPPAVLWTRDAREREVKKCW